jgi:predicted GIY-YIG superfamily endonuclease
MFYTYILRSINEPDRHYIGHAADLKARLQEHNAGKCRHSSKHAPWELQCYFAFRTEALAQRFEKYLKTGSGRAFAKRHFAE